MIVVAIFLLYLAMFLNTNSVVKDVKNIMLGNVEESVTVNTPVHMYNHSNILSNAEVKVRITRLAVCHNFFDGYMWVNYTYETVKNDNDIYPSSYKIPSMWKIHRENGKWQVVEITERP